MGIMIERLQKLKNSKNLTTEIMHMVEDAIYSCKPNEKVIRKV